MDMAWTEDDAEGCIRHERKLGKERRGELELVVLNIRSRNVLHAWAVLPQRTFSGNYQRNSHSKVAHSFAPGKLSQVVFDHNRIRYLPRPAVTPTRPCKNFTALNPWSSRCGCRLELGWCAKVRKMDRVGNSSEFKQ